VLTLPGADVESSLVANGSRVAGKVRRSILFPGVTVEPGAEVVDSVIMQDTRVGRGARVDHAIVDKFVQVGDAARVGEGEPAAGPEASGVSGLTLVGKYALIPDRARVGRAAVLGVGTGPEDFVNHEVRAGQRIPDHPAHADLG
jgi:glucose-1-phosphate adenylyltransferase